MSPWRPTAASVELTDKLLIDLTGASIEHAPRRRFLEGDPEALLFVEYYADSEADLIGKMELLEKRLKERDMGYAFVRALTAADQANMWALRKAGLGLLMGMKGDAKPTSGVEDICIPTNHLPEFVRRVQQAMARHGVDACYYGHCSVGVLHIRPILNLKDPEGIAILRALEEEMSDMALEYGELCLPSTVTDWRVASGFPRCLARMSPVYLRKLKALLIHRAL